MYIVIIIWRQMDNILYINSIYQEEKDMWNIKINL